jgi:hypothetical protein
MTREDLHFRLRIPEELKARIENAARLNNRSMTAEIVERLQWTFGPADAEFQDLLDQADKARELARVAHQTISDLSQSIREREQEIDSLKARLGQSIYGETAISEEQIRVLKGVAETFERRKSKHEIDVALAIATLREVVKLLNELVDSPEQKSQAVVAGKRVIESAATLFDRPYSYAQMKNGRFVDEPAPADPLQEVVATGEWLIERMLLEYRRLRDGDNVRPEA